MLPLRVAGTTRIATNVQKKLFKVRLAPSGQTFDVPTGVSILEVLRHAGVDAPSSSESGTCGACRTPLLSPARGAQIDIDL